MKRVAAWFTVSFLLATLGSGHMALADVAFPAGGSPEIGPLGLSDKSFLVVMYGEDVLTPDVFVFGSSGDFVIRSLEGEGSGTFVEIDFVTFSLFNAAWRGGTASAGQQIDVWGLSTGTLIVGGATGYLDETVFFAGVGSGSGPRFVSITPGKGARGEELNVTVAGSNTHFDQQTTTVTFDNTGITVDETTVINARELLASVTIADDASLGYGNVTVATDTEKITGANVFEVTGAEIPEFVSVIPSAANQGETVTLTVVGESTHFAQGSTDVSFEGEGVVVNSVTVHNETVLTASVTVAEDAAAGQRDVTVSTGGETIVGEDAFEVVSVVVPTFVSIVPDQASQGETLNVTIVAADTTFVDGESDVSFEGGDVTVNSVTVINATTLSANVSVAEEAEVGLLDVTVITEEEQIVGTDVFEVVEAVA